MGARISNAVNQIDAILPRTVNPSWPRELFEEIWNHHASHFMDMHERLLWYETTAAKEQESKNAPVEKCEPDDAKRRHVDEEHAKTRTHVLKTRTLPREQPTNATSRARSRSDYALQLPKEDSESSTDADPERMNLWGATATPEATAREERDPHILQEQKLKELQKRAKRIVGMDCEKNFNFGFCGLSGAGKSSLINAIRKLPDDDVAAASIDAGGGAMKAHRHPDYPAVVLWDLPGAGTAEHPMATYFYDNWLFLFDCLIVVSAGRFTEIDMQIARQAAVAKVPIVFVRNKADLDLESRRRKQRQRPLETIKGELKQDVEANIREQLAEYGLEESQIFLVSAWFFNDDAIPEMDEKAFINFGNKLMEARAFSLEARL